MAAATQGQPSWEDQIVPTLKKRLESESAYLSSRLSTYGVPEQAPASAEGSAGRGDIAAETGTHEPRQRTKSTPFGTARSTPHDQGGASTGNHAGGSGIPRFNPGSSIPRLPSTPHGSSRIPSGPSRPSGAAASTSAPLGSIPIPRVPSGPATPAALTRPRSKSTLAPRPARPVAPRKDSGSSTSSNGRGARAAVTGQVATGSSAPSPGSIEHLRPDGPPRTPRHELRNRDSFDLSSRNLPEVSIRNELPPFKLNADEAMRIAERGHALDEAKTVDSEDEDVEDWAERKYGAGVGRDGEEGKRKRSESMTPARAAERYGWKPEHSVEGLPESGRGPISELGLGTPSASARDRAGQRSATGPSRGGMGSSTTRSASMNVLASQSHSPSSAPGSRIGGVAAHLVPPESSFTPPKGANWDEVVLPAVAKKMGIGSSPNPSTGAEGGEGELAVEWDTNGTPTKWAKTAPHPLAGSEGSSGNGQLHASGSAFSPTFETSYDHPLNHPQAPPSPSPAPVPMSLAESDGRHRPMRPYNHGAYDNAPPSPAPFSQLESIPPTLAPPLQHQGSTASFRSRGSQRSAEDGGRGDGLKRKPSLLRREPSSSGMRQQSHASLRQNDPRGPSAYSTPRAQGQPPRHASFDNAVSGAVRGDAADEAWRSRAGNGGYGWEEYPTPPQSGRSVSRDVPGQAQRDSRPGEPRRQKGGKEGDHGKGCGCVVM